MRPAFAAELFSVSSGPLGHSDVVIDTHAQPRTYLGNTRFSLMAAAAFALALAVLVISVHAGGWLTLADGPVTGWLTGHRNSLSTDIALAVTDAGGPPETAALGVLVAAALWWRTRRIEMPLVLLFTVGASAVACTALKLLVDRARPPVSLHLVAETDASFPSGHVTGTATLVFMMIVVLGAHWSPLRRPLWSVLGSLVVVLVATSRIYLGVHWLTDTVAGALLAAVAVSLGSVAASVVQTRFQGDHHDRERHAL